MDASALVDAEEGEKPKLQAVLLADSFLTTFEPLSLDRPKVLCPLNNVALLDYAMDSLAANGVEEVFVVCTRDELETHLLGSSSSSATNTTAETKQRLWKGKIHMECIKDSSLTNAGDALRELYKRNVIQSDPFILAFGDVITNMDLTQAMVEHRERHAKDSAAIMTVILNPVGGHGTQGQQQMMSSIQSPLDDLVVALEAAPPASDTSSNGSHEQRRVLWYDNQASQSNISLPCSFFAAHSGVEVRTDLLDTGVYICSPDVLGRFEDEFDFLDISNDFIHNCVAEEEEGLQTRIYAHLLSSSKTPEYAARIVDLQTYHAVSQDLLQRWCYPMVPDNNLQRHSPSDQEASSGGASQVFYKSSTRQSMMGSNDKYLYKEVCHPGRVARSAVVQGPGMLGSLTVVDENAKVVSTVVGSRVTIGPKAVVEESHIWDNAVIEEGAKVVQSILSRNCKIGANAVISKGCVIGEGCIIGPDVVLPENTRITLQEEEEDPFADDDDGDWSDDDDQEETNKDEPGLVAESDANIVGKNGAGRVWHPLLEEDDEYDEEDDDDDDNEVGHSVLNLQSIGADLDAHYEQRFKRQAEPEDDGFSEAGVDDESQRMESEAFAAYTEGAFTFEDVPTMAKSSAPMVYGRQKGVDVVKELKEICMEFDDSGRMPMENLAIELNSYKFSQNASYSDCTMAAMLAILDLLQITPDMKDGKLVGGFKQKLEFWGPLLKKMSIGQPEELAIISGIERAATTSDATSSGISEKLSSGMAFRFLLQTLHDEEVLSEETLLAWAEERKSEDEGSPIGKLFNLQSVQDFIEWLEEDSEDEDDEDSDEDSESE
eukprot:Nitzschia sp. Nitz4//scaffold241_size29735//26973//29459//NITZ4_008032-RA/size29735-processed-gene-0.4-mRNA-1//1//CDS//3329543793//1265//frame0